MSLERLQTRATLLDQQSSASESTPIDVSSYRFVVLQLATSGSAQLTAKFQGSVSETAPDFSSAASQSNAYDNISFVNLQSGSTVAGDTGVVYSGTDAVELVKINTDLLKWLAVEISGVSAGNISVELFAAVK